MPAILCTCARPSPLHPVSDYRHSCPALWLHMRDDPDLAATVARLLR